MSQGRTTPIWPVNIVILFAFAMSVTAPRGWQNIAHRTGLEPPVKRPALAEAAGEWAVAGADRNQPRSPLPNWGRPAKPTPRVAAEVAVATVASPTLELPKFEPPRPAPAPQPTLPEPAVPILPAPAVESQAPVIATLPAVTTVPEAVVVAPNTEPETVVDEEEPPSLDRPRLSGGLRVARTTTPRTPVAPTPNLVGPSIVAPNLSPASPEPVVAPVSTPTPVVAAPAIVAAAPVVNAPSSPVTAPIVEPTPIIAPAPPAVVQVEAPPSWWPEPVELTGRLEALKEHAATRPWAERTLATLDALFRTTDVAAAGVTARLVELRRAAADALQIDERQLDEQLAVDLRLARYSLVRRLDVWESLHAAVRADVARHESPTHSTARRMETCLAAIVAQTDAAGETGRQWREFLLVDALAGACTTTDDEQRQVVARQALDRLSKADATEGHEFLREGPFAEFRTCLVGFTEEDVDARRLLVGLERFEDGGLPSDAHDLAVECERLAHSTDAAKQNLALWLNSHYRNANVRVAFSPELINRLMPASLKRQHPVNETILGKETRGWGQTRTGLNVRFVSHPDRMSVVLTAEGSVNAQTRTFAGPVRLFSASNSSFAAEKEIELTTSGVVVKPATALTKNNTRLRGIESDFDGMPILDGLITAIAQNKHAEKKPAAQREAALKISQQVERRLDEDLDKYLTQADQNLHARLITPLGRLHIEPEIVDLQSSEDRATIRLRSAGRDQLAANTPRPRVHAEHLGSVQVHQSAVNNVIDRFELSGRRFTLRELYAYITTTMNLPQTLDLEKLPEEMSITFGPTDPMTISLDEGRLELRMSVEELRHGERVWRNFTIRAPFRPEQIDDIHYFVRDGVVRISGSQLGTTQQISLRTVFAKVFPDDLRVRIWPERLVDDPRFANLDIAQIDLRDGWVGIAIGPRHAAESATPVAPAPAAQPTIGSGLLKALRR